MYSTGRGLEAIIDISERQRRDNAKRETLRSTQQVVASQVKILYAQSGVQPTRGLSWGAYVNPCSQSNRDDLRRSTMREISTS